MSTVLQVVYILHVFRSITVVTCKSHSLIKILSSVVGYIYVFGSGLLGSFLFQFYIEHLDFSSKFLNIKRNKRVQSSML